ncbi:MAG: hypothetical protein H6658_18335 [Ardenticatenaceae bacterium]|nr:hypothetical protein [Ardenticatenaceae bacterium]
MPPFLIVLVIIGVVLLVGFVFFLSIMRAYVKTPPNRAFVRTGGLGGTNMPPKVVMNGGAWVFRTIHEISWIDLNTMAIEIERTGETALLTIDPQYADIKVIFYIKVSPTVEGIIDAARTIGGKQVDSMTLKELVDAKLDGALRDVAATFTLMSLHQEREKFIEEVQNRLKTDLEENGLVLESVSILTLRAARQGSFGTDDVFGAQVARANAQVIQQALRERNDIERKAELEIKQRDTDASRQRLDLDRDLALAAATQEREVRTMEASEKAVADKKVFEELQKSEEARITKEQAVALAELHKEQELAVQNERKQQEIMATELARRQSLELADQQRQIALVQAEQERERAEQERLLVLAKREEAAQAVKTVEATGQAEREAKISIIQAEREANKAMIEQKNRIELDALRKQREAEAEAAALKARAAAEAEAALKQAETVRTQAQAETEAEKLRAEAAKARASAVGLAEADVLRAKASAAMQEAEATKAKAIAEAEGAKAKAEALAAYDGVAQRVEILKLQLEAQVQIEVAKAESLAKAMASMNIKMIGDPNAAASLLRMVTFADGLGEIVKATPQPLLDLGQQMFNKLTGSSNGDGLVKMANGETADSITELATLVPEIIRIVEKNLNIDRLKGQSVSEVLAMLSKQAGSDPIVEKAQQAIDHLPIIRDLPFDEFYLRATAK